MWVFPALSRARSPERSRCDRTLAPAALRMSVRQPHVLHNTERPALFLPQIPGAQANGLLPATTTCDLSPANGSAGWLCERPAWQAAMRLCGFSFRRLGSVALTARTLQNREGFFRFFFFVNFF